MKATALLLPLLVLYVLVVFVAATGQFQGDEFIYLTYARNLTKGYYSPPGTIHLIKGPGYPLILTPFVFVNAPLFLAKLLNAFLQFAAVVFFFKALRLYVAEHYAVGYAYALGLHPPLLRTMHWLLAESLTNLLVCGFIYYFCMAHREREYRSRCAVLAACFLAYLAMTKMIMGYVILATLGLVAGLYLWTRRGLFLANAGIYLLALVLCFPYLLYTYTLTGKVFYWSSIGGASLYWMTSPFEDEYGDWWADDYEVLRMQGKPELMVNHGAFFREGLELAEVEWDAKLKAKALENIRSSPGKFVKNWFANIGRLCFSYPFSYTAQKLSTYYYLLPHILLVGLSLACVVPAWLGRRRIPLEIWNLLPFFLVFLGGSSLVQATARMAGPAIPLVFLWIALTLTLTVRIKILR